MSKVMLAAIAALSAPRLVESVNATEVYVGGICDSLHNLQCWGDDLPSGKIGKVASSAACCQACQQHSGCRAWTWNWKYGGDCYLKSACNDRRTSSDAYHSGTSTSPSPGPTPAPGPHPTPRPTPAPGPHPSSGRKGSFLVIGDWGHDPNVHGNVRTDALQRAIAAQMLTKFKELGDVKFIVNLGDSFYPSGITSKSDSKWQTRWRDIYAKELRAVPWYTVYGNHDIYEDSGCACGKADGSQCNQINSDINNKNFFYMPSVNWHRAHPELNVEVVALDFNDVSEHPCDYGKANGCHSTCKSNLASRASAAEKLFHERYSSSPQKNLLVFSHYPTDYFRSHHTGMLSALKDRSKHNIDYFGGHRHNTDQSSTASIAPNNNWLVGGCGGWGCDGGNQGFVVGEITDTIKTYAVYTNKGLCQQMMSEDMNATKVYV